MKTITRTFRLLGAIMACWTAMAAYAVPSFAPGRVAKFATTDGNAAVIGFSDLTWKAFAGADAHGNKVFVNSELPDAECTSTEPSGESLLVSSHMPFSLPAST